jgi:carboxypeptidase C (cathepsin A)
MSHALRIRLSVIGLLVGLGGTLPAQGRPDAGVSSLTAAAGIVVTHHEITLGGRRLRYTARAGLIPIRVNETGEVHARMFFISYTLDVPPSKARRPIAFVWNGGPGSSSSLVHLIGFGPKRLTPDGKLITNDGTWLAATDLVFVDPVGTGYSRPVAAEFGREFYSDRGDAESIAEFIRVYLERSERWDAPLFLAGESFGVRRAGRVADVLERHGTAVRGVVLMGLALPLDTLRTAVRTALAVPTFTAAAFYHRKLAPPLQDDLARALDASRHWATNEYAPALARRDSLSDGERQAIREQLSRFTAIPVGAIDPKTLTVPLEQFAVQLLRSEGKVIGRYDTRLSGPIDTTEKEFDPTKDPSLVSIIDDHAVLRYLRDELTYESDLKYQGPFGGGYPPLTSFRGDWMSVKWDWNPPVDSSRPPDPRPPLERALRADPRLRVLIACGWYDLMCDVVANEYAATHLDEALAPRVFAHRYFGGHAVYTDAAVRLQLQRDVIAFIEGR